MISTVNFTPVRLARQGVRLMKVRDERQPGHYWADNEVIEDYITKLDKKVRSYALSVYTVLTKYASPNGTCNPSIPTIADTLGLSDPTVKKALRALESIGLISINPQKTMMDGKVRNLSNEYVLLSVEKRQRVGNSVVQVDNTVTQGWGTELPRVGNSVAPNKNNINNILNDDDLSLNTKAAKTENEPVVIVASDEQVSQEEHQAYQAYKDAYPYENLEGQSLRLYQQIPRTVTNIDVWKQTLAHWKAKGYRGNNISGLLSQYQKELSRQQSSNSPAKSQSDYERIQEKLKDLRAKHRIEIDQDTRRSIGAEIQQLSQKLSLLEQRQGRAA